MLTLRSWQRLDSVQPAEPAGGADGDACHFVEISSLRAEAIRHLAEISSSPAAAARHLAHILDPVAVVGGAAGGGAARSFG